MPADKYHTKYVFQNDWFEVNRSEWKERTAGLRDRKLRILEIGSFEGVSTTWILDNLMNHPESNMVAIDTFEGGMEHQSTGTDGDHYQLSSLEQRFRHNVSICNNSAKLRVLKANSDDALIELRQERARFDFIYIDGSHVAIDVLHDAVCCWRMLEQDGTIVFDDYSWKGYLEDCYNPRIAIESFVRCVASQIESKETEYQLWIKKVENRISATANPDPALYYWDKGLAEIVQGHHKPLPK